MSKIESIARIISIALLFLIGINAIVAGLLFIVDSTGNKMGISVDYLSSSPFRSYLIPGIILFIFNGVLNIIAGILSIKRIKNYPVLIFIQGIILAGWIIIQIIMVRDINPLHVIMFLLGLVLIICSLVLKKFTTR